MNVMEGGVFVPADSANAPPIHIFLSSTAHSPSQGRWLLERSMEVRRVEGGEGLLLFIIPLQRMEAKRLASDMLLSERSRWVREESAGRVLRMPGSDRDG